MHKYNSKCFYDTDDGQDRRVSKPTQPSDRIVLWHCIRMIDNDRWNHLRGHSDTATSLPLSICSQAPQSLQEPRLVISGLLDRNEASIASFTSISHHKNC